MLNLDTHILIFALQDELTGRERRLLHEEEWSISDIVLWEITKLIKKGRISLEIDQPAVLRLLSTLHQWPITLDVARASLALDFESDPADEIIAATSIVHDIPLLTRDRRILTSRRVPLA